MLLDEIKYDLKVLVDEELQLSANYKNKIHLYMVIPSSMSVAEAKNVLLAKAVKQYSYKSNYQEQIAEAVAQQQAIFNTVPLSSCNTPTI